MRGCKSRLESPRESFAHCGNPWGAFHQLCPATSDIIVRIEYLLKEKTILGCKSEMISDRVVIR